MHRKTRRRIQKIRTNKSKIRQKIIIENIPNILALIALATAITLIIKEITKIITTKGG